MGTVHLHPSAPGRVPTITALAEELEAAVYRCPTSLEPRIDHLLSPTGTLRVLALTGRGGAGKSAALREIARRARRAGREVVLLDGRVDDVVAGVDAAVVRRPDVLLVDGADDLGAGIAALGSAIAALPAGVRIVVAGRRLAPRWLPDVLDPVVVRTRLAPLPRREAEDLLLRRGVTCGRSRAAIVAWAGGLPLALTLGARAWAGTREMGEDVRAVLAREAGEELLEHLADAALAELDPDLLVALSVGPGVDVPLLGQLFPGRVEELLASLRACTVVEAVGSRLVLHPTLAAALARRLRAEGPARTSAMVLRTAAHEHDRAVAGEPEALTRLAALIGDPALRSAMGPTVDLAHYADRWRPGDSAVVRAGLESLHPGAWELVRPWRDGARVVRRPGGRAVAVVAALPLLAAAAVEGPRRRLLTPVVEHARAHGLDDRAVLSVFQLTFADNDEDEVAWVRNAAGLAQCGVANPRHDLVNLLGASDGEREVLRGWGYAEIPALSRMVGGVPVTTWVADAGPAGLAGVLYTAVAAEQGAAGHLLRGDSPPPAVLIEALEAFHSDAVLAALPVAPRCGASADAAEQVRAWVRTTLTAMLADHPALLELVVARYLVPGATHESAMRATYLSRATYFRRLRRAREVLAGATA